MRRENVEKEKTKMKSDWLYRRICLRSVRNTFTLLEEQFGWLGSLLSNFLCQTEKQERLVRARDRSDRPWTDDTVCLTICPAVAHCVSPYPIPCLAAQSKKRVCKPQKHFASESRAIAWRNKSTNFEKVRGGVVRPREALLRPRQPRGCLALRVAFFCAPVFLCPCCGLGLPSLGVRGARRATRCHATRGCWSFFFFGFGRAEKSGVWAWRCAGRCAWVVGTRGARMV